MVTKEERGERDKLGIWLKDTRLLYKTDRQEPTV